MEKHYCELCDISTTSHQQLQAHMCGRSHMDMVQRSEMTQRWVYVHGFSSEVVSEDDLCDAMSQFGGVVSVIIKTATNDHCYGLVEYNNVDSALNALKHTSSVILKRNTLTIKPRTFHHITKHKKSGGRLGRKKCVDVTMATADYKEEVKVSCEMIGGIRLSPEAMDAISSANCVNKELEAIASHCRLSNTVAEQQLELAWQLQNIFRIYMPLCIVIPFGAPFSGHGTVSSDCDLCLLSNPTSLDISMFTGSNYLPSHLHGFWEHLQTTPLLPRTKVGVAEGGVVNELGYDDVIGIIRSDKYCSNVLAIRNARCPIIRFLYDPHQLHCDLSINNRLGPANTRLLAAYMNFDSRMSVLVPCVRLWARGCGLKRSHINNYALSLLLIHSLQHTVPPVLPCLQEPGIWPKDMSWIVSKGLMKQEQSMIVNGWNCSFIDSHSLLPSTNTSSSAQLLLHFFNYLINKFSFTDHIVAIHTLSYPPYKGQSTEFKVSSLCVQDPFEQSHNVTKTMKPFHLRHILQVMTSSQMTLQQLLSNEAVATLSSSSSSHDILSLFRPSGVTNKPCNDEHFIELDMSTASHLLHETQFTSLEGRLEELNLNNEIIQQKLSYIIVTSLASHLEKEFDFKFHSMQTNETMTSDIIPPISILPENNVSCSSRSRKRCRGLEEDEMMMDVEYNNEDDTLEPIKRQRLTSRDESSAEHILFSLTEGHRSDSRLECISYEATWIDRRRKRRHPHAIQDTVISSEPCLSFILSASIMKDSLITIKLQLTDINFQSSFHQFFAVFKKSLFS